MLQHMLITAHKKTIHMLILLHITKCTAVFRCEYFINLIDWHVSIVFIHPEQTDSKQVASEVTL